MKAWRNGPEPRWPLNNGELCYFLEEYVDPNTWIVELTGGEPTLYGGFNELLQWLSSYGYYTLVKTNGTRTIARYNSVKICSAFHRLDNPPICYDEILIVDKIQREEKEAYCKEHGIPYRVIGYDKENPDGAIHGFTRISFINPAGHNLACPASRPMQLVDNGVDYGRIDHANIKMNPCCSTCKPAIDAWRFLPDEIKARRFQHIWH